MNRPKRFLECSLPVTFCNLECPYCYIIQENRRSMKISELKYSPSHIARALRKERLGGECWINICGSGETFAQKELIDIVLLLLKEGHYVNITSNGTFSSRIKALVDAANDSSVSEHLHFAFSFHYTELVKRNLIDSFFDNINYVKSKGASFVLQMNLCDDYIPHLDEIKRISLEKVGAFPQLALTRDENKNPIDIFSELSFEEYCRLGKTFKSPLFDFTCKNFNVKREEFCYAGDWSAVLDLSTGYLRKCYNEIAFQDIFKDPDSPIVFSAIGYGCKNIYCFNSSHFLSLGVIPSLDTPTYSDLRNRPEANWYGNEMKEFLNTKLAMSNCQYSAFKKYILKLRYIVQTCMNKINSNFVQKIAYNIDFIAKYLFPLGKKAILIGTCEHENLGDSAIAIAEKFFLENCGFDSNHIKEITYSEYVGKSGLLKRYIGKNWLICGLGGGSMGDQWYYDEEMRRSFIKTFPRNQIVIFPQSIYYNSNEEGINAKIESIPYYENHKNLVVAARDRYSYEIMKNLYPNTNIILTPDIVLSTDLNDWGIAPIHMKGVLVVFRKDEEKKLDNDEINLIEAYLANEGIDYTVTDTNVGVFANKENRLDLVKMKINEFANSELVITDRLHGLVFSVISGTPCIVFNNYNHKVIGTYEWLKSLDYVKFANNAREAVAYIPLLLKMKNCTYEKGFLNPYFKELEKSILQ